MQVLFLLLTSRLHGLPQWLFLSGLGCILIGALSAQANPNLLEALGARTVSESSATLLLTNRGRYFSPNLDNVKDTLKVPLEIEESDLMQWKVYILKRASGDSFDKVKTFGSFNPKEQNLSFTTFFSRIVASDESIVAPPFIDWDGTDESGKQVADGVYYFSIEATDRTQNKALSEFVPIILDTENPQPIDFKLAEPIFSPNQDGVKETLKFTVVADDFYPLDEWTVSVLDRENQVVKVFKGSSMKRGRVNQVIRWDGKNELSQPVPEGFYRIKIVANDLAGNKVVGREESFELVRTYQQASLEVATSSFSPNGDGYYDTMTFSLGLTSQKKGETDKQQFSETVRGLRHWEIRLRDKAGKVWKTIRGKQFRNFFVFDGSGEQRSRRIPDNTYEAVAEFFFKSGNHPKTSPFMLKVDTQNPKMILKLKSKYFNPQSDPRKTGGVNRLRVEQVIGAPPKGSTVDSYQGVVLNQSGEIVFQTNFFTNLSPIFEWNGVNESGAILSGKYIYQLRGEDEVGNIVTKETSSFQLIAGELKAKLSLNSHSLSPNADGKFDRVTFTLGLSKNYKSNLKKGRIDIFETKRKKGSRKLLKRLIYSYPLKRKVKPFVWDGVGKKGKLLKDGVYLVQAYLEFNTEEKVTTPEQKLYLDTTPVLLDLKPGNQYFSPNNDGHLDSLYVTNNYKLSQLKPKQDKFFLKMINTNGVIYQQREWKGDIPARVGWNGEDQLGNMSPEGVYIYEITTVDHAGNREVYRISELHLVRKVETLGLNLSDLVVTTLKGVGLKHTSVEMNPQFSDKTYLKEVNYFLKAPNNKVIQIASQTKLPEMDTAITFPSLSNRNSFKSGLYHVQAKAKFLSGNQPESPLLPLFIDNLPPDWRATQVNTRPRLFSPDSDGINEALDIRVKAEDNYAIDKVNVYVFREEQFEKNEPFIQTFSNYYAKQIPLKVWSYEVDDKFFDEYIQWNGQGDLGELVESATEYLVFARIIDKVGLITMVQNRFTVDILVDRLSDGRLRIILNSITFKYNSDKMQGKYEQVLKLLMNMLRKFPDYQISVEGHTDSRGSKKYNQKLSKARAKKVVKYLIQHNIKKDRISYKGQGEGSLKVKVEVVKGDKKATEQNYRKNRRVEFYLKKKK